jgi:two-component system sensor histidine kinase/response regulator
VSPARPAKGPRFAFTARLGLGSGQGQRRLPNPDLRGRRILVVDDNENAREVVGTLLRSMRFEVEVTASGTEALQEITQAATGNKAYDLIMLDWHMPDLDGIATARAIAKLGLSQLPLHDHDHGLWSRRSRRAGSAHAGIADVVAKPVTASSLFDALIDALGTDNNVRTATASRLRRRLQGTSAIAGRRILLVEDNELNQEVARDLLVDAGLQVDIAENGL